MLLQESGERRLLGVGVVWEDYGSHFMPGWLDGTVGYHVDDGKLFYHKNGEEGEQLEGIKKKKDDSLIVRVTDFIIQLHTAEYK